MKMMIKKRNKRTWDLVIYLIISGENSDDIAIIKLQQTRSNDK